MAQPLHFTKNFYKNLPTVYHYHPDALQRGPTNPGMLLRVSTMDNTPVLSNGSLESAISRGKKARNCRLIAS